jgi:arylsulfatase A-like enzyme
MPPNVLLICTDQLRAGALPIYGDPNIRAPNIDRLAAGGVVFDNAFSNCPLCGPARASLLTGRYPQTTGHIHNYIRIRHDEISLADAFAHAGYRTAWIGKWHLHTGACPVSARSAWIPEGRDRLGFNCFRAYNYHHEFFDGHLTPAESTPGQWRLDRWKGYETEALARYGLEFIDRAPDEPFLLCLSPHQPHPRNDEDVPFAPQRFYDQLPDQVRLPDNVPAEIYQNPGWPGGGALWASRHYMAMILAVDEMVGALLDALEARGLRGRTLVVFTSDHGSMMGAHGIVPWKKQRPYEEAAQVPLIASWPDVLPAGTRCNALVGMVDLFPTLCGLCGVPVPQTVQGSDLSGPWLGRDGAAEKEALFLMNFTNSADHAVDGNEWRSTRTKDHSYIVWRDGRRELYDMRADRLQQNDLSEAPAAAGMLRKMQALMAGAQARLHDELRPATDYVSWFDHQRRVVRNAFGPLPHPESPPDFSLLRPA